MWFWTPESDETIWSATIAPPVPYERISKKRKTESGNTRAPRQIAEERLLGWAALLPHHLAIQQQSWERNQRALRMRQHGMLLSEIGKRFGVGKERARQMVERASRRKSPPIAAYCDEAITMQSLHTMFAAYLKAKRLSGKSCAGPMLGALDR